MSDYVYFTQRKSDDLIKIGHSTCVTERLAFLRTKHGKMELLGLIPGTISDEKNLHEQFGMCRVVLEWFNPRDELMDFINTYARPYPLRKHID